MSRNQEQPLESAKCKVNNAKWRAERASPGWRAHSFCILRKLWTRDGKQCIVDLDERAQNRRRDGRRCPHTRARPASLSPPVCVRQMQERAVYCARHETRQSTKGSDHVHVEVQRMRRREVTGLHQAVQQVPPHPLRHVQRIPVGVQGRQTREVRMQRNLSSPAVAINPAGRRSDSGQKSIVRCRRQTRMAAAKSSEGPPVVRQATAPARRMDLVLSAPSAMRSIPSRRHCRFGATMGRTPSPE
jgi:hypothetical protein